MFTNSGVVEEHRLAPPPPTRSWTSIDAYIDVLYRRRSAVRRKRRLGLRTEPESPNFLLSTLPFVALLGALAVLAAAIMIAAWPGQAQRHPSPPQHELGTAAKGWFQEAQKQFHN